ncbi:MAG TPA: ATP-binding protein [Bacteroidota bacterium]|nr:ATP-binding protein [Bacteroidota bacterium]
MENSLLTIESLKANLLFKYLSDATLQTILKIFKEESYPADSVIFQENTKGEKLYLILEGKIKISKVTRFGIETVLATLSKGDFFGEMELLDELPRSARTTALEHTVVAGMSQQDFDALVKTNHIIALNMLKAIVRRLRIADQTIVHELDRTVDISKQHINRLNLLIEATKSVNSTLDLDRLLEIILDTAVNSINADRGTLYLLDESKNEIWSTVLHGAEVVEIRLPIGKGLAGYVAKTGETINIPDAYNDSRFNPDVDKRTGYRTHNMLCMPMRNRDGKLIGVFQLLNKKDSAFTKADEEFINALSMHASIAIENARIAKEMVNNERLTAVGRMASTIIHDIKNPMGTLRVYAQVMKKKSGNEEASKLADEMITQVDRFVTMTQEILDFSRGVNATNIREMECNEVLDSALVFIERDLTKRNITLTTHLNYSGPVRIDPEKMMRAFYNIAINAADAMPKGGSLTITTENLGTMLMIEFADTGIGMPEEVKRKIFEPFVTHGKKHGTGLGMSIVKKIMDDHNGKIEIESELGKGTAIKLFLPLSQ